MDNYFNESALLRLSLLQFFMLTTISFTFLYFGFSILGYALFNTSLFKKYQLKALRPLQIQTEIKRSVVSILMFGVLSLPMYYGLHSGFYKIIFEFSPMTILVETFALFLWNEVHFYTIHRIFHNKRFYKFHADHHYSHVPTPFAAYSFHWSEGLLLGAVMPIAMCFHNFQVYSLLTLPLTSIIFNVLGHSNMDFFPSQPTNSLLSFSKRHSLHHKIPHANYGFALPYFDRVFRTSANDDANK